MAKPKAALFDGEKVTALERVPLVAMESTVAQGSYSERWLQERLQRVPELLPIGEIEPGFGRLLPVSIEVSCSSGCIDNLFVTADGGIAIVEVKLWRSTESRRAVVAQLLSYAAAVGRMTYPEFEAAALAGEFLDGSAEPASLYSIVASADSEAPSEEAFIDAISLNLRLGRFLLIVAGDGIRSECESLAELLQSHAGARFTFALVAIELFALDAERVFAVPRTIAKTVLIERGVVRVDDARIIVEPPPAKPGPGPEPITMTEELFFERMATLNQALPAHLRAFLDRIATLGVEPVWKQSLNLKWFGWPDGPINLGNIPADNRFWTDQIHHKVGRGRAKKYLEELAARIGGGVRDQGSTPYVVFSDGRPPLIEALLPQHADALALAMQHFIERLRSDLENGAAED